MDADLILVGGGLANGLIALRLAQLRPEVRVLIAEAGTSFGGNHTWSFFDTDLTAEQRAWTAPLVAHRWPAYSVHFPTHERRLETPYNSVESHRLHEALTAALPPERRLLSSPAVALAPTSVQLADQRVLHAHGVIDARGQRSAPALDLGWQKFVGLEVELEAPHGLDAPIVMDARVDQLGGYRFVYVLPFTPTTCLIEDTYYTDGPDLADADVEARIHAYAAGRNWRIARIIRRERGILPIAIAGDIAAHLAAGDEGVAPAGMAAALFHAITGYSFPNAVRTADLVAALPDFRAATIDRALRAHAEATWASQKYYRLLNKMLFRAAEPSARWRILDRFYKLDAALVGRFYAGQSSAYDKLRILAGKPPVPVGRAIAALLRG